MESITNNDYYRWQKLSRIICKDHMLADEILHMTLEKILKKEREIQTIDSFMFISLRNTFLTYINNEQKKTEKHSLYIEEDIEEIEDNELDFIDVEDMLNTVVESVLQLTEYDQNLFILYFKYKYSCRRIASIVGASRNHINIRVNEIKKKIKEEWQKQINQKD